MLDVKGALEEVYCVKLAGFMEVPTVMNFRCGENVNVRGEKNPCIR